MSAATEIPSEAILQYCRTARRLRHRLRHSPAALHGSLRSLKPATPVAVRPVQQAASVFDAPPAEQFALLVRYSLVGNLLPYSARQALLRKAARMGIKRFDANLVIAMVQHQAGASTIVGEYKEPRSLWALGIALAVQILIALSVYVLMRT